MSGPQSDTAFGHEVARFYESKLVPLIFEPYAGDLAARIRSSSPEAVLEVACGTGVVSRALASNLPTTCSITASDLNSAMVEHAERIGTCRPVTWRRADVMELPFADGTFDIVACQFGTMFFPDRVAAYREIRRVLRPGGAFLFNVWNEIERNAFADEVTKAMTRRYPHDPPVFLARTPHGHGSTHRIESDLQAAGYETIGFEQLDEVSRAASPDLPAIAYCQGTPLRNEIEAREPGGLEAATREATVALRDRFGDGPIEGQISAVVVTAS